MTRTNIFVGVICFVLGMLLVQYNPNTFIQCERMDCFNDSTHTEIKYLPGKDSTYVDTFYISNTIKPASGKVEKIDSSRYEYTNTYIDTLVEATVVTVTEGKLLSQTLSYTIDVPKEITERVDTIVVNEKIYYTPKLFHKFYGGVEVQGNAMFLQYGLNFSYQAPKNNIIYEVGYNFNGVMGNNISMGIKVPLFKIKSK